MRGTRVVAAWTLSVAVSVTSAWAQEKPKEVTGDSCGGTVESPDTRAASQRPGVWQPASPRCVIGSTLAAPPPPKKSRDAFAYARLGFSGLVAGRTFAAPAMGAGYRHELGSVAFDVSFLNIQGNPVGSGDPFGSNAPTRTLSGSVLRFAALKFTNVDAPTTPYLGGGVSFGITELSGPRVQERGAGSQAELTAGVEFMRDTAMRVFIQTDVILPLYRTYGSGRPGAPLAASTHYTPSVAISVGIGFHPPRRHYGQAPRPFPPVRRLPWPPPFPWRLGPV